MQAYQLISGNIAKALVEAKRRVLWLKLFLIKHNIPKNDIHSLFFDHVGIPVWIDNKPTIAHNKIIILVDKELITGSYNYSKNAEYSHSQ